jgi:hypothetical protein
MSFLDNVARMQYASQTGGIITKAAVETGDDFDGTVVASDASNNDSAAAQVEAGVTKRPRYSEMLCMVGL